MRPLTYLSVRDYSIASRSFLQHLVAVLAIPFVGYVEERGIDDELVKLALPDDNASQLVQITFHF